MAATRHQRIVLASGSPRRRELLEHIGFEPVVHPTDVPELQAPGEAPDVYTRRLSKSKAAAALASLPDDAPNWVLAADTIVVLGDAVLEKPADAAGAAVMLARLSNQWHTVITSFTWQHRSGEGQTRTVSTRVRFRELSTEWIARYVATGEPLDKAGAYGIQDIGAAICREIEGSYSAVVGLPLCEVVESLEELGGLPQFPFAP